MGKRTRKTRWRTLPIGDERSDSEESNSTLDTRIPPTYHQKYFSRLTYSSQSTPTRRYQSDSTKSTRSSSTASENKITFNEDEYTRITTPRQDVLFKKGYLNKPKTYSTQTSTGNSTNSTGNSTTSTGNGTPDYQSTDLEYESHFVFPNGFMDHSGIYYVNSYDPYPLVVYNAPPYYSNETCNREKKYSTESLTETASANEETSQDAMNHSVEVQGEEVQHPTPPLVNGNPHHSSHIPPPAEYGQVYNVVYPGFYYNGSCPPHELVNGQDHQSEPKRIKRRRRRKLSISKSEDQQVNGTTSEYTEDDDSSADEEDRTRQVPVEENQELPTAALPTSPDSPNENTETEAQPVTPNDRSEDPKETEIDSMDPVTSDQVNQVNVDTTVCDTNGHQNGDSDIQSDCTDQSPQTNTADDPLTLSETDSIEKKVKYDLKPDAQEFVPRFLRPENIQFFKIPPNFVPVPLLNPMGAQNYSHPYIPTNIPINFIHQNHPIYPGFVPGFVPPNFNPAELQHTLNGVPNGEIYHSNHHIETNTSHEVNNKADVDIRTVVSKLEQVANEPVKSEGSLERGNRNSPNTSPNKKLSSYKYYDERKKYHPRNNKLNGYFHKRPYNRYQANGSTHNNYQCEEETADELEECSKSNNPQVIVNDHQDIRKVAQSTEKKVEEPTSELLEAVTYQLQKSVVQNELADKETNIERVDVHGEVLNIKVSTTEANSIDRTKGCCIYGEKITVSPKFQHKPSKEHQIFISKTVVKSNDDTFIDAKKRWPQRDEKCQPRWEQQIQPQDKTNLTFKQNGSPSHQFNKRIYTNSPVKRLNNQNIGQTTPKDNMKKFSDTVKKLPQFPPTKSTIRDHTLKYTQTMKPDSSEVNNTLISKTQWIPVSNKKKRRNRNVEEAEDNTEILETPREPKPDEFEQNAFLQNIIVNSHSVNQETKLDRSLTEIIEHTPEVARKSPVKVLEVRELEKELLSSVGVEIKEEEETAEVDDKPVSSKNKSSSKKKSKKGNQKQPTKRIILTDVDLSGNVPDTKSEDIIDEPQQDPQEVETEQVDPIIEVPPVEPETVEEKPEVIPSTPKETASNENPEKKSKKKKKKQPKTMEISSSTTTLNSCEDTYDLLLENTFSTNSDDKTNMEVSQELDLIIQRGMYSSLEEKIKSLNIIPIREEFFQSVVRNSREPSTEKTPEFSKFLTNSMPKFKYCMATMGDDALKVPLSHLDQPSTSKDLFVENLEVNELLKNIYGSEADASTETKETMILPSPSTDTVVESTEETFEEININSRESSVSESDLDKEKLYPITLAVKKWMTKTRENTPEIEILKSPSVIFKEFCEKPSGSDNIASSSSTLESDEEVTVYSATRNNSGTVDLLDCWENEIPSELDRKSLMEGVFDTESRINGDGKEDEELLEIYESKYGQNEDFLQLQKEIEEKKRQETDSRSRNFPKHGALPYRAICCNVM